MLFAVRSLVGRALGSTSHQQRRLPGLWRAGRSTGRDQSLALLPVFLGANPPPQAGALGHGVTAAAHLFGHVAPGDRDKPWEGYAAATNSS